MNADGFTHINARHSQVIVQMFQNKAQHFMLWKYVRLCIFFLFFSLTSFKPVRHSELLPINTMSLKQCICTASHTKLGHWCGLGCFFFKKLKIVFSSCKLEFHIKYKNPTVQRAKNMIHSGPQCSWNIQCIQKVFRPLHFIIFCYFAALNYVFPSSVYTQYPIMTNVLTENWNITLTSNQVFRPFSSCASHFSWSSLICFYTLIAVHLW